METIILTIGISGVRWILGILLTIVWLTATIRVSTKWDEGLGLCCFLFGAIGALLLFAVIGGTIIEPAASRLLEQPGAKIETITTHGEQTLNEVNHDRPSAGKCSVEYTDRVWRLHNTVIREETASRIIRCW
jgi:hypothetical protein